MQFSLRSSRSYPSIQSAWPLWAFGKLLVGLLQCGISGNALLFWAWLQGVLAIAFYTHCHVNEKVFKSSLVEKYSSSLVSCIAHQNGLQPICQAIHFLKRSHTVLAVYLAPPPQFLLVGKGLLPPPPSSTTCDSAISTVKIMNDSRMDYGKTERFVGWRLSRSNNSDFCILLHLEIVDLISFLWSTYSIWFWLQCFIRVHLS